MRTIKDLMALWLLAWIAEQIVMLLTEKGFLNRGANFGEKNKISSFKEHLLIIKLASSTKPNNFFLMYVKGIRWGENKHIENILR